MMAILVCSYFIFSLHFYYNKGIVLKLKVHIGVGEMVKWLKELDVLAEDSDLASSTCMVAHDRL